MRRPVRTVFRSAALLTFFACLRGAVAGDVALAEVLFRQGRDLMDKGDLAAACPKLGESYEQDPATGTLLALAFCQEQQGKTASAWASFAEAATRSRRDGNRDRETIAEEHEAALEPLLSRLTLHVDAGTAALAGLTITRDGVRVGEPAWGVPGPLDPGDHVIVATAPGKRKWTKTVTLGARADAQTISVPLLEDAGSAAAGGPPPPPATAKAHSRGAEDVPGAPRESASQDVGTSIASEGPPLRTIGIVTGGLGVLGLGVSGFFALRATSLNGESNADGHCTSRGCDDAGYAKRKDAVSAATTATVSLVAGSVLTVVGATLFIVGGPRSPSARVSATPVVGANAAGVVLDGRF